VTTDTNRAGYIAGLRMLADILEADDTLPLPVHGRGLPVSWSFWDDETAKTEMARVARALPGKKTKDYGDTYFRLGGQLSGLNVQLTAMRAAVCERVVTGVREVTVTEPDPDAPTVTRVETVEDVEWRCSPLLADLDEVGE
jgi:hypothetical protein